MPDVWRKEQPGRSQKLISSLIRDKDKDFINDSTDEHLLMARLEAFIDEGKSMVCTRQIDTKEILDNVFSHVETDAISAVLLRGSRATGRSCPFSDVDVVLIAQNIYPRFLTFRDSYGVRYNLQCFANADDLESMSRFYYGMKPIYDPDGYGSILVSRLNSLEKENCKKRLKKNAEGIDYLYKLAEYVGSDDIYVSTFFKAKLIREYPAFISSFNGYDLLGYKHTIDCLLRDNYSIAMLFAAAMDRHSGSTEAQALVEQSFVTECGLNALNTDFTSSPTAYQIDVGGDTMYELYENCSNFIRYIRFLKEEGETEIDFLQDCETHYPTLFARLWKLMH